MFFLRSVARINIIISTGWSDIYGLSSSDREDRTGFDESAARVNTLLQQEIDKGIAPARIVIAGFSQGGALAFHTALRSAHTLGGIVALSTWVPLRDDYPASFSSAMSTVPILQVGQSILIFAECIFRISSLCVLFLSHQLNPNL